MFAMNEKNGIGEAKPKQSWRQGESAPELSVGRAYDVFVAKDCRPIAY